MIREAFFSAPGETVCQRANKHVLAGEEMPRPGLKDSIRPVGTTGNLDGTYGQVLATQYYPLSLLTELVAI